MSRAHSNSHSRAHSPTFPSLHLRHNSFSNPSIALPTSQLILQPFRCFSYVTVHSPTLLSFLLRHKLIRQPFPHFTYVTTHSLTLPSLYLRHSSFSNPSVASPTSQFILQPFFHFSCVTSSFSNLSVTSPTWQLILQPFRRFTYVTAHSPTLPLLHLRRSSFTNPSFASPAWQALHLIHLTSRPWSRGICETSRVLFLFTTAGLQSYGQPTLK